MKKVLIFLLLLVIFGGMIYIVQNPFCYNHNYWDDINIKGSHLYSNIIMQMGEPKVIKNIDNESIVEYTDIEFIWYNTDLHGIFARVEITTDTISIGKNKLCVGSDKKDVENAYKSVFIKEIQDLPQNSLGYIDDNIYIIYSFDEYDKVKKISISHGV
jgi:hypothetical protein